MQLGVDPARSVGRVRAVQGEPVEHPAERHLRHGDALCLGDLPGDRGPERGDALHELTRGVGGVERGLDLLTLGGQVVDGERRGLGLTLRDGDASTSRRIGERS